MVTTRIASLSCPFDGPSPFEQTPGKIILLWNKRAAALDGPRGTSRSASYRMRLSDVDGLGFVC